jgi:hypothetical protein
LNWDKLASVNLAPPRAAQLGRLDPMKSQMIFLTLAICGADGIHAESKCRLPSDQLLKIAQADQRDDCRPLSNCEFVVMESEMAHWCAVQVWGGPKGSVQVSGNFVTLIISNSGVVVRRIPGA